MGRRFASLAVVGALSALPLATHAACPTPLPVKPSRDELRACFAEISDLRAALKTLQERVPAVHVVPGNCSDLGHDKFTCAAACPGTEVAVSGTCGLTQDQRTAGFMLFADLVRTGNDGKAYTCEFYGRVPIAPTGFGISAVCLK